ncbi:hypothetical protein LJR175_008200 [Variovorax sp. LjRoot175]|uniref:hypothetical protein n=1 Tax=Variovorax sp. LjRoot175 TaxID=3342276 RepID=UPI003ECD20FD
MVWNKPGAGQDDFSRDRYACLQESQQRVGSAAVNQFGGIASNTVVTNSGLFGSCMNAHGWYLGPRETARRSTMEAPADMAVSRKPEKTPLDIELGQLDIQWQAREVTLCFDAKYASLYAKGSCKVKDITPTQILDTSKADPAEKMLLVQLRSDLGASINKLAGAYRQAGRPQDVAMASALDAIRGRADGNIDALIQESINWGQYNKARAENAKLAEDDRKRARPSS